MSGPIEFYQAQYEWIQAWFAAHPVTPPPVVTPPVDTTPRTQADDFAAAKAVAFRSFTLRDPADLGTKDYAYAGKGYGWGTGNEANPFIDARGLHFIIPPHSNANAGGSWGFKFADDDSILIGVGESVYLRWMQRWSAGMREIVAQNKGTKFLDIGTGGQADQNLNTTNSNTKVVMQTHYGWMAPILYTYPNMGLEEVVGNNEDFKFQNQVEGCLYTNNGAGCWQMPTDEDVCFQLGIDVLDRVDDDHVNSRIRLWATKAGVTTLLHDWNPSLPRYVPQFWPKGEKQGRVNVFPYMTGKDPSKDHPEGHVWVWHIAAARQKMPDPTSLEQSPEPAAIPVSGWAMIAHDFDPVTLTAGVYRYGAEPAWTYLQLPAGAYTVLPDSWGIPDPAPGVRKSLDRWTDASPPDVPIITPGGAPVPAHPAPPIVVPPSSGYPAWRRGAKVGQWLTLPGTENCNGVIPREWAGTIDAWGGLAATDGAFWSAACSGHGEWWNPVLRFDWTADVPRWVLWHPGSLQSAVNMKSHYADGLPMSRHGYRRTQWLEARHARDGKARIMLMGAYAGYSQNLATAEYSSGPMVDAFRIDDAQWDAAGTWAQMPYHDMLPAVARDPRDGSVYVAMGYTVQVWSPPDQWTLLGRPGYHDIEGLGAWDTAAPLIDVKRNRLTTIIDGRPYNTAAGLRLQSMDLATHKVADVTITGDLVARGFNTGCGFTHDEDGDRYLHIDQGMLYEIDPDSGVSTRLPDVLSPIASTESRFAYFPKLGGVGYVPRYDAPVMFRPTR